MKKYFNKLIIILLFAIACIFFANSNVHASFDFVYNDSNYSLPDLPTTDFSDYVITNSKYGYIFVIFFNSSDTFVYNTSSDGGTLEFYVCNCSWFEYKSSSNSWIDKGSLPTGVIGYPIYSTQDVYSDSSKSSVYYSSNVTSSEGGSPERGTGESGNTGDSTESTGGDSGNTTDIDDNSGFFASVKESLGILADFFKTLIDLLNPATFLKGVIESIGFVGDLLKFDSEASEDSILVKIFDVLSYLNPLSDNFILKDIIGFFITLLDYLNPFSDNFILLKLWDFFTTLISYINPLDENFFGYKIMDLLSDLLKALFVPDEERITAILNTISSKFDFVDSIKIASNSISDMLNNMGNAPKLTINVSETKYTEAQNLVVLDLSFYKPFKPYGDLILTGFIYIFFLWRLFISLPNIIHGLGGAIQSDYMVSDIQSYNKFGFGRSASLNTYQDRKNGGVYRK